jgi:hypothetical protein
MRIYATLGQYLSWIRLFTILQKKTAKVKRSDSQPGEKAKKRQELLHVKKGRIACYTILSFFSYPL